MIRITFIVVAFWALAATADAQTVTLSHTPVSGDQGDFVEAQVNLDSDFEITGWSYSVCPDPDVVILLGASPGSTTQTIFFGGPPAFQSIQFTGGGVIDSVVICTFGCTLPPGDGYELLDLDYELVGSPGALGELCFCELGVPPVPTAVAVAGAGVVVPDNACAEASVTPCTAIVPNRGIESFEVLPRAGEPGRFDLVVNWAVETATPEIALDTTVVIEVGGSVVAAQSQVAGVGTLTCCDDPSCSDPCGLWFTGLTFETGECALSPGQGDCACRLTRTTTFLDLEIPEGVPVTARVQPMPTGVSESILEDDSITRLAPYFNRELLRTAWIPDPDIPGNVRVYGFVNVTASAVDAEVDFGFELVASVGGTAAAETEVEIKIPGGVDPCLTLDCGSECMVPEGGNKAGQCRDTICAVCTQAIGVVIGSLAAPAPGTGYEFEVLPIAGALAEASPGDDFIVATYTGFQPAPNRRIQPLATTVTPSAIPGHVDVELGWRAETGGTSLEDLSVQFVIEVNGVEQSVVDSTTVLGTAGVPCSSGPSTCSTWTVAGLVTVADCDFSEAQATEVCGVDLTTSLTLIPASEGDAITITLVPALDAFTEVLTEDDTITLQLSPPFVRGNANGDSAVDLGDAIALLVGLFESGPLDCFDAADVDDDGLLGIADPIVLLAFLFQGAAPPASPFPGCGGDPSDDALGCSAFPACP